MKSWLMFVALVILCPCALFSAEKPNWNGYWWSSTTLAFKLGWVSGYTKAMDFAGVLQIGTCAENMPLYKEKFPNTNPKDIMQKLCLSDTTFDYDGIAMGQFVDGMDAFYKDYRNKQLEVAWAIEYVRDEIKGKSAHELDRKLALWRRCSAAYQNGNTEQITNACKPDDSAAPERRQ